MILKAQQQQKQEILDFLNLDQDNNFFLIGDIETYDLHSEIQTTYVKILNNKIQSVILIYNATLLFYDPFFKLEWGEIYQFLIEHKLANINISQAIFDHFQNELENNNVFQIHKQYLAKLNNLTSHSTENVVKATKEDIANIVLSRLKIKEFFEFSSSYENELKLYNASFDSDVLNPFIIKNDKNEVISCAAIMINASNKSIIGGVYTLKEYRNQGLASKVVAAISNWIINNNRVPVLFYHNQHAGKVYKKIGYQEIGILYTITFNWEKLKEQNV